MQLSIFQAIGLGLLTLLSGCSATGPVFRDLTDVPRDKATVYVYRPAALVNSGNAPNLFVNGVDHGQLWNAGYIPLSLTSGKTTLVLKGDPFKWGLPPIETVVALEAGKIYYVRFGNQVDFADYSSNATKGSSATSNITPTWGRTIQIQWVPTELGRREIMETHLAGHGGR
jgi:hypothetical protein